MVRWWIGLLCAVAPALYGGTAADLARALRENSFDREECYRVRDIVLTREDARIYLNEGHLIFSKPVDGRRVAAVFTADVEAGDAELLLFPPDRAERRSLAKFTETPNLNEHFRTAVFLFTGKVYESLKAQFDNNPANKKAPEIGAVLDEEWTPALRSLSESYQTRLVFDLMGGHPGGDGLFAGLFGNAKFSNFDLIIDPESPEEVTVGQVSNRNSMLGFDMWTNFQSRSTRNRKEPKEETLRMADYRIEATVHPDVSMDAIARVKVTPTLDTPVVAFDLSSAMEVSSAKVDGQPAEVLQREAMRVNLRRAGNGLTLVVPPEPLKAGREYEFEFHFSGRVIQAAGERVFVVNARGNWYPTHGQQFANYELLFRVPKDLDVVIPGTVVEDKTEGEWHIVKRRTAAPIRLAGFNLGAYAHSEVKHAGYTVDVCANKSLETALQPKPVTIPPVVTSLGMHGRSEQQIIPIVPSPVDRLRSLAGEVSGALEFFVSRFGPPALPEVAVSPIPGAFGQGFPGLIYISTMAYLKTPPKTGQNGQDLFFSDILQSHEMAHQWWGNRVTAYSYRDYWLMEAMASYSALLYIEKTKGPRFLDMLLDEYRSSLLRKTEASATIESAGPIVLGPRLETSQNPDAWRDITYGKGSWIIHMLRRRLGDQRFLAMLAEVVKRYDRKEITTEQFRQVAASFLPPKTDDPQLESFFDQWVYGTGIPSLKMTYDVKGKAPAVRVVGTITQSDVEDAEFSAVVPVEIQLSRERSITQWVRTANTPVSFTVSLKQAPLKVTLDPNRSILRR